MEWQPAILINAHPEIPVHPVIAPLIGKKVRVRDISLAEPSQVRWLQSECDTQRAFEVHPDDWDRIVGKSVYGRYIACEHEILTD